MPALVIDCSAAMAWCFEDEATSEFDALLDRVQVFGAIVPPLFIAETSNVLLMACRRKRLDKHAMLERLALFDMMPFEIDAAVSGPVWRSSVVTLAESESLTFYDAVYLELAIRRGLPLATSDRALRRAAQRQGVAVVPAD